MLKIGDQAPLDILVTDDHGLPVKLRDVLGPLTIIYFYPKDDTPGCTTEACSFRDSQAELAKLNAQVIGVSKDPVKSHQKFHQKHELNFPLWSDPDHQLAEAFGVWVEKSFMGRKYMGMERSTFVLDEKGKIIQVWLEVTPKEHGQAVVEFIRQAKT